MDLSKIANLYNNSGYALERLLKAKKNNHPFLRNEESFKRFLGKEIKAALRRVAEGVPSGVCLLENTLDQGTSRPDFVVGKQCSFEYIQLKIHYGGD